MVRDAWRESGNRSATNNEPRSVSPQRPPGSGRAMAAARETAARVPATAQVKETRRTKWRVDERGAPGTDVIFNPPGPCFKRKG